MWIATAASRFSSFLENTRVNRQNLLQNWRVVQLNRLMCDVHFVLRIGYPHDGSPFGSRQVLHELSRGFFRPLADDVEDNQSADLPDPFRTVPLRSSPLLGYLRECPRSIAPNGIEVHFVPLQQPRREIDIVTPAEREPSGEQAN